MINKKMELMVNLGTNPNKLQPTPPAARGSISQLTHIDISKFSQSELYSLSLFDDASAPVAGTSFHHHLQLRPDTVNPSLFNESQTFSIPRSGRRTLHPLPAKPPSEDPHLPENKSILKFLKDLVKQNSSSEHARKRKRGKTKQVEEGKDGSGNGVENAGEVYEEELRQRTVGMQSEEALLGFLRGLEGQWGSTRKKRRIVDVGLFSVGQDALPAGWKLVLALRRRSGRVSVFCRRYISPSGQQFQSFKDAVQSLNSYLGLSNGNPSLDQGICRTQQSNHMDLISPAVAVCNVASTNHIVIPSLALSESSVSEACEEKNSFLMIDDLPEVEVQALFECCNCKINFDELKAYKNHVYLFHSKTTKLISFDTSDGRGLEIMGQKYQCEFCNKLFIERSHYDSHVALHTRNPVQDSEKLPGHIAMQRSLLSHTNDVMSSRLSKMDALLQIASNSLLTSIGDTDKIDGSSPPDQLNKKETSATRFGNELRLGCCPSEKTGVIADGSLDQEHSNDNHIAMHVIPLKNVGDPKSQMNESLVCTSNLKHPKHDEVGNSRNTELSIDCGISQYKPNGDVVEDTSHIGQNIHPKHDEVGNSRNTELPIDCGISQYKPNGDVVEDTLHIGQNIHHNVNSEQSLQSFPSFTAMPKGDDKLSDAHGKIDRVTDIELGVHRQSSPGNSLMNGPGSPSSPEKYKNSASNNAILDDGTNASVEIRSESINGATDKRHQFITICVWCRTEFYHEIVDLETITDSIGFMCPTCKQKISGHWDSGLSMNSYRYN